MENRVKNKPRILYILFILWLLLSSIFIIWGLFSLPLVIEILSWPKIDPYQALYPMLYFGYLLATISWFVVAGIFLIFSYGSFIGKSWAWTSGIIFSTIFIVILGLMLISFMVTAILFRDFFSVFGLETVVLAFLIDIGIIYYLSRPSIKAYFEIE